MEWKIWKLNIPNMKNSEVGKLGKANLRILLHYICINHNSIPFLFWVFSSFLSFFLSGLSFSASSNSEIFILKKPFLSFNIHLKDILNREREGGRGDGETDISKQYKSFLFLYANIRICFNRRGKRQSWTTSVMARFWRFHRDWYFSHQLIYGRIDVY